jgi:hypothetical protein
MTRSKAMKKCLRLWVAGALIVMAAPASAGFVAVQVPGAFEQVAHPLVAEEIGPGYSARADLSTGEFPALSSVDGGTSFAYSTFNLLQIRWLPADGVQVLNLPLGSLWANVSGILSVPVPPDGALGGNVGSSSETSGGGQVFVGSETPNAVDFDLVMPALLVNPDQVFTLDGLMQTNVLSNGGLVTSNGSYQLYLALPSNMIGSLINTATGTPLDVDWVTVPEPSLLPLIGLALLTVARLSRATRGAAPS